MRPGLVGIYLALPIKSDAFNHGYVRLWHRLWGWFDFLIAYNYQTLQLDVSCRYWFMAGLQAPHFWLPGDSQQYWQNWWIHSMPIANSMWKVIVKRNTPLVLIWGWNMLWKRMINIRDCSLRSLVWTTHQGPLPPQNWMVCYWEWPDVWVMVWVSIPISWLFRF